MQGAADPEHFNKYPVTLHPSSKLCRDSKKKNGRAAACWGQTVIKLK
jgi:hypothetical protein